MESVPVLELLFAESVEYGLSFVHIFLIFLGGDIDVFDFDWFNFVSWIFLEFVKSVKVVFRKIV